jgi:inosine/xanthosine triphosphatase
MKIAVGTDNPIKYRAVRNVMRRLFPDAEIIALQVPSRMPSQPRGDRQTRRGAANRAHAARIAARADWGIGIEAGVVENEFGMMTCAWCAIEDRTGRASIGGSTNMLLPDAVAERLRAGAELGPVMDEFTGIRDVKRKMGAIGIMTRGLSDRRRAYEFIVKMALAPFLSRTHYKKRGAQGRTASASR